MSAQLKLFSDAIVADRVKDATIYARQSPNRREAIIGKLREYNATDLSDHEIERCLKGCAAASLLIKVAKGLRDGGDLTIADLSGPSS